MKSRFSTIDTRKIYYVTFFGVSTFIGGLLLLCLKGWMIDLVQKTMIVLQPNSMLESSWRKMPMTIPTDVYFFNWSNPQDFHNFSIKPKFEQAGPYRFLQSMENVNVVYNDNNTVTYNKVRTWQFDDEYTKGTLSDNITTLNSLGMLVAHYISNWNYFLKRAASVVLTARSPDIQITRPANHFLFEGSDDMIMDIYNYFPFFAPEVPRFDKFGWFHFLNASETFEGVFNMGTGVDGNFDFLNWNYNNVTPYFNGSCGKVHGSAGDLWSAKPSKDYTGIFSTTICRFVRFDYVEEVYVNGILGYKYELGAGALDNGTLIPENKCYCAGDCLPSGLISLSSCRYGLPIYLSLSNFYGADPTYVNAVEGLRSEKEKDESYLVLEPETAVILEAVIRIQLNIRVHPIEDISLYEDVPDIVFPLLWVEQAATLPDNQAVLLKLFLNMPLILLGISIVLIIVGLYLLLCITFKPKLVTLYQNIHGRKKSVHLKHEEVPLQMEMDHYDYIHLYYENHECT